MISALGPYGVFTNFSSKVRSVGNFSLDSILYNESRKTKNTVLRTAGLNARKMI
jgi:hypothetical protein